MFSLKEVRYKDILDIKSLNIKKYKVTCIVGQSGSGKTTLLRLLNKLISCDSGEIFYENQPLANMDSIKLRREVVMLPQSPAIFNGSIRDNLLVGLKFSEKPLVPDDKLSLVLNMVNLNKGLNDDAEKLSGGEKQRLALGRVILIEPEVLLLDEPSSALDEGTEHMIIEALVNYTKEKNKTLIMVTHSRKVANNFSDEIIEIERGRLVIKEGR
jgi:putative ABC transport system ATP-binding protein